MSAFQYGNPYAPPWMGFTPILKGIRDLDYDLDLPAVSVPANSFLMANVQANVGVLVCDGDTDYLVREFQFVVTTSSGSPIQASDIRVRIRDGKGRLFTSDFIPIADLSGPLCPPWPVDRGSVLLIDYQNINASWAETVWLVLKGWKRYQCPGDPTEIIPSYTPMYRKYPQPQPGQEFEDFEYPFTFTQTGAVDLQRVPLQTDNDADFWWCGIAGDFNTANNDVAVVGSVGITFYDAVGLPMMQAGLINPWNSPLGLLFRESVFSSGGARPAPIYPAIWIPRGGVVSADFSFGQAATLRFSLRGKKVYGACR
jgi:hypothetical protein